MQQHTEVEGEGDRTPPPVANGTSVPLVESTALAKVIKPELATSDEMVLPLTERLKSATEIVAGYKKQLRTWNRFAMLTLGFKAFFIYAAGICGALAAVFARDASMVQWLGVSASAAALASAVVDRFGTPKAWRDAWRTLETSVAKYEIGQITINQLVERHHAAENMITIMVPEQEQPKSGPSGK